MHCCVTAGRSRRDDLRAVLVPPRGGHHGGARTTRSDITSTSWARSTRSHRGLRGVGGEVSASPRAVKPRASSRDGVASEKVLQEVPGSGRRPERRTFHAPRARQLGPGGPRQRVCFSRPRRVTTSYRALPALRGRLRAPLPETQPPWIAPRRRPRRPAQRFQTAWDAPTARAATDALQRRGAGNSSRRPCGVAGVPLQGDPRGCGRRSTGSWASSTSRAREASPPRCRAPPGSPTSGTQLSGLDDLLCSSASSTPARRPASPPPVDPRSVARDLEARVARPGRPQGPLPSARRARACPARSSPTAATPYRPAPRAPSPPTP